MVPEKINFLKKIHLNLASPRKVVLDVGGNKVQSMPYLLRLNKHTKIISFESIGSLNIFWANTILFLILLYPTNGLLVFQGKKVLWKSFRFIIYFWKLNYNSDYLKLKIKILGNDKNRLTKEKYSEKVIPLSSYINDNI